MAGLAHPPPTPPWKGGEKVVLSRRGRGGRSGVLCRGLFKPAGRSQVFVTVKPRVTRAAPYYEVDGRGVFVLNGEKSGEGIRWACMRSSRRFTAAFRNMASRPPS